MNSLRLTGPTEKLGSVSVSDEFLTWEVPDKDSSSRMRHLLKGMGRSSLVLDDAKYGGITVDNHAHASFIESEEFKSGRDASAHDVRFGQLILNGRDFRELPELVAVKPFTDREELYREWAAHEYLNSLTNRQIGYLNLGVHNNKRGVESIISEYDHDVVTFDSSFWASPDDPASTLRPEILQRHARLGSEGLGFLHGVGMTHGDAQVKNLAADRLGFRAVDLESAQILEQADRSDPLVIAQTRRDLSAFIDSMKQVEANREKIHSAFTPEAVRERVAQAYINGAIQGRAVVGDTTPHNIGELNIDYIHSELDQFIK